MSTTQGATLSARPPTIATPRGQTIGSPLCVAETPAIELDDSALPEWKRRVPGSFANEHDASPTAGGSSAKRMRQDAPDSIAATAARAEPDDNDNALFTEQDMAAVRLECAGLKKSLHESDTKLSDLQSLAAETDERHERDLKTATSKFSRELAKEKRSVTSLQRELEEAQEKLNEGQADAKASVAQT